MWNLKRSDTHELTYKTDSLARMNLWLLGQGGRESQGVWDEHVHSAVFKMDNQQGWTFCIAHGTLLNVMWQPGWEGRLEENGYMYMYG